MIQTSSGCQQSKSHDGADGRERGDIGEGKADGLDYKKLESSPFAILTRLLPPPPRVGLVEIDPGGLDFLGWGLGRGRGMLS